MRVREDPEDWATETLKESPFWREGMRPEEYDIEREYLYRNYNLVLDGTYKPLWKQKLEKERQEKENVQNIKADGTDCEV